MGVLVRQRQHLDADRPPSVRHPKRELHIELDKAVWAAYGWPNFPIPPYTTPQTHEEKKDPYFTLIHEAWFCEKVLSEFGADPVTGLIVNGHVPVKI